MIVLHLSVFAGQCWLWGEMPPHSGETPTRRRGRPPKAQPKTRSKAQPAAYSPYNAGHDQLAEALAAVGIQPQRGKKQWPTMTAWLPSLPGRPVGSSGLVAEPPAEGTALEIKPWLVSAVPLAVDSVIDLLAASLDRPTLAHGVVVGRDVTYWARALQFAGSLAARGCYLPGVRSEQSGCFARWEPVIMGEDWSRMTELARAIPAASWCLTAGVDGPPTGKALPVLTTFIGLMVDTVVRTEAALLKETKSISWKKSKDSFASVHEQWLDALASPTGLLEAPASDLSRLTANVTDWRRKVWLFSSAPFRLCFRLEEPPDDSGQKKSNKQAGQNWTVRYLLQDRRDPSLLVPVADVWSGKKRQAKLLAKEYSGSLQEFLLTALGQAASLCPPVEVSLRSGMPAEFELDNAGAHEFLTAQAPFLQQAGFAVILPAWWTRSGTSQRLSVRAKVSSPAFTGKGQLSLDQVVSFDWEAALGDEVLSRRDLEELAGMKSSLVRMRGQWVEVNASEIQAALNHWQRKMAGPIRAREVVRLTLGAAPLPRGLTFAGGSADGWMEELLDRLTGKTAWAEQPVPHGFQGSLRPYQHRGYSWLEWMSQWGFGACLADDMGLGKTVQTLTLIQERRERGEKRPFLLVCPTSVIGNWQREAARFTPDLPLLVHHGLDRQKGRAFQRAAKQHAMVITSYSLLARDVDLFQPVAWAGVVLDEAQNIKNPQTRQAQAARSLSADFRVVLTGTPVENNVGDLWSIMEFLNPGFLGSQADFKRNFLIPIQVNRNPEAVAGLKQLTGPFVLRRLKTDKAIISDLPEKIETLVFCHLTREQASLYTAIVKEVEHALEEAEGIERKGLILATLSKLKQVCDHPALFLHDRSALPDRSGKLARLTETCEEILAVGERGLIFTQFAEMGGLLRQYLMETFGQEVLFLHGGVPKKERDRLVDLFQGDQGPPFFILSLKAGGTGLNLTRANHVFHFDRWWNPAVENQATDRAFRLGQVKNVQVHKFVCLGTIEEQINKMIERKTELAEQVVGSGESWLTELSTRELKDILTLRQEAFGD